MVVVTAVFVVVVVVAVVVVVVVVFIAVICQGEPLTRGLIFRVVSGCELRLRKGTTSTNANNETMVSVKSRRGVQTRRDPAGINGE